MLYTNEFIATLPDVIQFENPWVVTICKLDVHEPLRALIEQWFENLPDDAKAKLRAKLQSQDNDIYIAAFHELAIHQYCLEEGWKVEYEPTLPNGLTPDLVIHTQEHGDFCVDVTTLFDSEGVAAEHRRKEQVTQKVTAIKTDFVLELNFLDFPAQDFKPAQLANVIQLWLSELPPESNGVEKTFDVHGCHINIMVHTDFAKPSRGCVAMVGDPGGNVPDYTGRIKKKLNQKRTKYSSKNTGMPLLVVIADGIGLIRADADTVDKALFGQHQLTWYTDGNRPAQFGRDRSGFFTPSNDAEGNWRGKNTGISAVMHSSYKSDCKFQMQMSHNPFAQHPLPFELFSKMPQLIRVPNGNDIKLAWALNEQTNIIENPENSFIQFS
jgi:hypothetical protein